MVADVVDTINSLAALIEEETDKLCTPGLHRDLPELVSAKVRLVARLEAWLARTAREHPAWLVELDEEARRQLAAAVRVLIDAASINCRVLERQISLSTELMTAIACEAQRLIGARNATYGAHGCMVKLERAAPLSINARL